MQYYSAIKKNEILLFAATWAGLESIVLCEVSQTRTDNDTISLPCGIQKIMHVYLCTKQNQIHRRRK